MTLSIVEAIWNLPGSLLDCNLATLTRQTEPPLEIVIVNASSSHELFAEAEAVCAKYPLVRMVSAPYMAFNLSRNLNVGIRESQGEYVMLTAIDQLFSANFLSEVYRLMGPGRVVGSTRGDLPASIDIGGADTLIEVKTAGEIVGRREFGAPGSDHVPRQYWLQCQFQLARTRRSVCILAVLIGGRDYREYRIPADPAIQAEMDRRALEWWATYVESDCPPPFDGSDSSDSVLRSMFPQDSGEEAQATPEMEDAIEDGQKLYQQFCAAETAWKAWRQNFQAQMGEASRLTSAFGRFSWKAQTRRTTDWRKLAQALGASKEQIAAHTKESTARPFLHPFEESK